MVPWGEHQLVELEEELEELLEQLTELPAEELEMAWERHLGISVPELRGLGKAREIG